MSLPFPGQAAHAHGDLPTPRWQQRIDRARQARRAMELAPGAAAAPPQRRTLGDLTGLCLPVAFPDVPASVTREEIDAFCNQPGYQGFGNNGSVFDYYRDNSNGKLRYRTVVAPTYTALHPRAHYTDPAVAYGQRAQELVREAVAHHVAKGFDFGGLSTDGQGVERTVRATNLLYAGPAVNQHSQGLWPHASTLVPGAPAAAGGGLLVADYQVTATGEGLSLGVYCHENGHMLCDFPDLYQYGDLRAGCGNYCLMSFGAVADTLNPPQVGAYLKFKAGWGLPEMIETGRRYVAPADGNRFFMLQKSPTEYFLVEHRQRAGRDAALPDEGLAVWHVDELGSNTAPASAPEGHQHYECTLVQADGRNDLVGGNDGDATDLFPPGAHPVFSATARPSSRWWDGSPSRLQIRSIEAVDGGLAFIAELG